MTKDELKSFCGFVTVRKDLENQIRNLRKEIDILNRKAERATPGRACELLKLKEERLKVVDKMKCDIEGKILRIEQALSECMSSFTPLERIVVQKLYVEGLRWKEFEELMWTDETFADMRFETSAYKRAHRRALDKMGIPKTQRGGVTRVQKAQGN